MADISNDLKQQEKAKKLNALKAVYSKQLPGKLTDIENCWYANENSRFTDAENLQTLYRLVHSLAGSAGTFGFKSVSIAAKELEHILLSIIENGLETSSEFINNFRQQLTTLKNVADQET